MSKGSKVNSNGYMYTSSEMHYDTDDRAHLLSRDEYLRMEDETRSLRKEIADINAKINNDKSFRLSFRDKGKWDEWVLAATKQRDALLARFEELRSIINASHTAQRAIIKQRYEKANNNAINALIRRAMMHIRELAGSECSEEYEQLMGELAAVTGSESPLLNMVHRDDMESEISKLKAQHATEMARERAASQQAVGVLRAQIRDIQDKRSRASVVLSRLYGEKYTEVDEFRKRRGVTHRIHLTAADCAEIDEALS